MIWRVFRPNLLSSALLSAILLTFAVNSAIAEQKTYKNPRFGTSVTFPADIFIRSMEPPANGDGMSWSSKDGAVLSVFGSNNALDDTPAGYAKRIEDEPGKRITYKRIAEDWLVISGVEKEQFFYMRYQFGADGVIHGLVMRYPSWRHSTYDPLVSKIAASLDGP
ncbi:hypothetical protein ABFT80_10540 [Mesorhizobium sp. SB112]|uniref:hypothetical protein n=1 Tax=Mesorhizobium sp. SB112 TaxID=3151853 RepID=UPI0032637C9B